jgi:NADPH:quinone reductase-like Zn-dependent oxidoreductase
MSAEDATMKAYLIDTYKSPMQAGDAAEPTVGDRDVLVDFHAAGVNQLDAKIRDGEFKFLLAYKEPFTLRHDQAGVVTRVGSAVTRLTVGGQVYGRPRDHRIGTFAERIAVHEDDLAIKPARLSMAEAASVPLVFGRAGTASVPWPGAGRSPRSRERLRRAYQRPCVTPSRQEALGSGHRSRS